jgi:hypothetical protein
VLSRRRLNGRNPCEYSDPVKARLLLVELRQAHGLTPLLHTQSDDGQAVTDLYPSVHNLTWQRAENRESGEEPEFMIRRRVARGTI